MTDESNLYAPPASDLQPNPAGAPFGSFATFQDGATRAVATIVGLVASPILSALAFVLTPRLETDASGELAAVVVVLRPDADGLRGRQGGGGEHRPGARRRRRALTGGL